GLAFLSATMSSIVVPGWILSWECIIVSMETISPELTVSLGASLGSSQPHCTVSSVAASLWRFGTCGFASAACKTPAERIAASSELRATRAVTTTTLFQRKVIMACLLSLKNLALENQKAGTTRDVAATGRSYLT